MAKKLEIDNNDDQEGLDDNIEDELLKQSSLSSFLAGDDDDDDLDDEDDEDDDEGEDDDEEEIVTGRSTKKKAPKTSELSDIQAALAEIKKQVSKTGDAGDKKRVSKLEQMMGHLVQNKVDVKQVTTLWQVLEALKEDMKEEAQEEAQQMTAQQFRAECWKSAQRAFEPYAEKFPQLQWSEAEVLNRVQKLMTTGKSYQEARDYAAALSVPPQKYFNKAMARVIEIWQKQNGINSGASKRDQLDLRSTKSKGSSSPRQAKNGDIDLSRLSDYEKDIYLVTLNETKDKELALEALKEVREARRSR